ncbi:TRAP transporter substrate-binding protein DctP [Rhodospirillum sp. A1_3_36]|uniref:TRAP transporter substrate-binding protein n=1 Tax=Rhodospirillum sp. A1_3_36 TaxID=3391666 RepID=UPI0039A61D7E
MIWFPVPFLCRGSLRRTVRLLGLLVAVVAAIGLLAGQGWALTLKAAHSHGEGQRELRHRVLEVLADQVAQRTGSLQIKIYPRGILFREGELWTGLTNGTLEIAALPLVRLRGLNPMFAAPSLPGLAATEDRIHAFSREAAMEKVRVALEARGVRVLADMWVPGVFIAEGSTCVGEPDLLKGERVAAGGRMAGDLAEGQGADLAPSELGNAPRLLDGREGISVVVAPELDLIDGGAPKGRACVTLSNGIVPWFDYEPILISQKAWNLLTPSQSQALTEAAAFAESYGRQMMDKSLETKIQGIKGDHLTWVAFTEADYRAWRRLSLPVLAQLVGLPMSKVAPKEDRITVARPSKPTSTSTAPSAAKGAPEMAAPKVAAPEMDGFKVGGEENAGPTNSGTTNTGPTGNVVQSDRPEKSVDVRYVIKRKGEKNSGALPKESVPADKSSQEPQSPSPKVGATAPPVAPGKTAAPAPKAEPTDTTGDAQGDTDTTALTGEPAAAARDGNGKVKAVGLESNPPPGLGP